ARTKTIQRSTDNTKNLNRNLLLTNFHEKIIDTSIIIKHDNTAIDHPFINPEPVLTNNDQINKIIRIEDRAGQHLDVERHTPVARENKV
uniref:hypothetical protein n=1 Tax=Klebsiella pneumoniae TaxID=573 RepID=UPI0019521EC3